MIFRISPFRSLFVLALCLALLVPAARAQIQSTQRATVFRGLGMLGAGASLTRVKATKPAGGLNRVAPGATISTKQNLTGPLKFSFTGYTDAQRSVLQNFVSANYDRMVAVYGAPAPEQAGQTIKVRFAENASEFTAQLPGSTSDAGNTIFFGYDSSRSNAVNTYNFTRLVFLAFQGARAPSYDFAEGSFVEPWYYGMADAAALQIAYLSGGSRADFNPSAVGNYALGFYDYLNRPELGNAFVYSRTDRDNELAISFFRVAMAQAAFLKVSIENPNFFAQFNARLYARGAAGASIAPAELKSLAAGVTPTVEGRAFSDWVRAQYALDATVTTGQKLYLVVYPLAAGNAAAGVPAATIFTQAFVTNSDGSESPSSGFGSLRAYDLGGTDISNLSGTLNDNNVLSFNNSQRPGEGTLSSESVVRFASLSGSNRMLVTLKASFAQAEATNYVPYGAAGTGTSVSSFFGGVLGAQNGSLQLSGSANQNVAVTRGTFEASVAYPSGPRVQTALTFGGVTQYRNTAWLTAGDQQRSVAFLLQVPSALQSLNFSAPAGQSPIRMISLPGFPVATDEAAALNIAPAALDLARYRPSLSPATVAANGALQFGIGSDRYELYPNIAEPMAPGRGYWLGVGPNGYSTTVQASLPPADRAYEVPLQGGWNQIGVPFNRAFAAASIQVRYGGFAPVALATAQTRGWVAPGIWRWRPAGGYVRADSDGGTLTPFEGYFIFAGPQRGVSLVFNPNATASARSARAPSGGWSVSLRAAGKTTDDIAGRFGVMNAANIAKPPAAARVISLRFEGADAGGASASGSGLAEAYVAPLAASGAQSGDQGAQWTAIVDGAAPGERVSLQWGRFDGALDKVRLSLTDSALGKTVPMKSGGHYEFVSNGTPRRLVIAALQGAFAGQIAPTLAPAPARTADVLTVLPNPNGFADDTKLTYFYVWRNGRRILDNVGATLDLSQPGSGNRGDTISVEVTARDGAGNVVGGNASTLIANSDPFLADGTLRAQSGITSSVELFSSDADGDELRLYRSNSPARGVAEVRKVDGVWTLFYTGFKGASGADEVSVVAFDDYGGRSEVATVKVNVSASSAANRAPVAFDGVVNSARGEVATAVLRASDADGDALSFRLVKGTKFGTSEIALDPADGLWKLRARNLRPSDDGTDSAQFVAVDGAGVESNVATVTIYLRNRAPVAADASGSVLSGEEVAVAVSGSDPDGDALTFKRVGGPRDGTGELRRDGDGLWKMFYRSRAGWTGTETIRYVALDGEGRPSAPATISITVTASAASSLRNAVGGSAGGS